MMQMDYAVKRQGVIILVSQKTNKQSKNSTKTNKQTKTKTKTKKKNKTKQKTKNKATVNKTMRDGKLFQFFYLVYNSQNN